MFERILFIILPVLLIVLTGWLYSRRHSPDMSAANKLNMDVCVPLLLFSVLAAKDFHLAEHWKMLPAALGIVLLSGLLAWPAARLLGYSPRTLLPPSMFNNCGNMGLPLALLAFGHGGFNGFVVLFVVSNLLHFTLGAVIFGQRASLAELARNPIVLATLAGFGCGLAGLHLPDWLLLPIKMLGDVSIPLMLFALGVRMVGVHWGGWGRSLLAGVVCPLTGLAAAAVLSPLLRLDQQQIALVFLFGALPPAVLNFLMAERYVQEPDKMASIVLVGNLASLLFVPLGLWLGLSRVVTL